DDKADLQRGDGPRQTGGGKPGDGGRGTQAADRDDKPRERPVWLFVLLGVAGLLLGAGVALWQPWKKARRAAADADQDRPRPRPRRRGRRAGAVGAPPAARRRPPRRSAAGHLSGA